MGCLKPVKNRVFAKNPVYNGLLLFLVLFLVAGCKQEPTPTAVVQQETVAPTAVPAESSPQETITLPTLYPTPSPFPTPEPTQPLPTSTPRPTATPIDFSQLVVEVRYTIPGLELDRTLRGNISSQLELVDETTGERVEVADAPGVMFDLQQTLPETELSELPAGCDFCVHLSFELFLTEESGDGWLQDPVLLASFENFFSARLGPHFPPGTAVGLRRSATPYNVAHTVAVTADGQLWRWTATEPEVSGPETDDGTFLALLSQIDLETIKSEYIGPCPEGSGYETLLLNQGETEQQVEILCPELALPLALLPLYLQLDALADEKTADTALEAPEPTVPLDSVLYYQREDGGQLILFVDGRAQVRSTDGLTATAQLGENQAIDTAIRLAESGNMELGVLSLVSGEDANILIARGLNGVYEIGWNDAPPDNLSQIVEELDGLLDELLADIEDTENGTPTPAPEITPAEGTPTLMPSGEETPQASPEQ